MHACGQLVFSIGQGYVPEYKLYVPTELLTLLYVSRLHFFEQIVAKRPVTH